MLHKYLFCYYELKIKPGILIMWFFSAEFNCLVCGQEQVEWLDSAGIELFQVEDLRDQRW